MHPPPSPPPKQQEQPQPQPAPPINNNDNNIPTPTHPFISLTPHLSSLTTTASHTRALLAHTVYQTTHLASSHQSLHAALLRLAAESHMLPAAAPTDSTEKDDSTSDSISASVWARTARNAEAATEAVVRERVAAIRRQGHAVDAIVELCLLQARVVGAG